MITDITHLILKSSSGFGSHKPQQNDNVAKWNWNKNTNSTHHKSKKITI